MSAEPVPSEGCKEESVPCLPPSSLWFAGNLGIPWLVEAWPPSLLLSSHGHDRAPKVQASLGSQSKTSQEEGSAGSKVEAPRTPTLGLGESAFKATVSWVDEVGGP